MEEAKLMDIDSNDIVMEGDDNKCDANQAEFGVEQ